METIKTIEKRKEKRENYFAEKLFFMYAMPCIFTLRVLGRITDERYKFILSNFIKGKIPSGTELEEIFSAAFRRMKIIAKEIGKNYWDEEVILKYWRDGEHNRFIDNKEGIYAITSNEFNEFCKIHKAKVIDVDKNFLKVKYDNKIVKVAKGFLSDVKIGDIITIHLGYAIEKID